MKSLKLCIITGLTFLGIMMMSCQHEPLLIPGTPEVSFQKDVMLIINSNCNVPDCHGQGGEKKALNTYSDIHSLVTEGKPMKSKLHKIITANSWDGNLMPPKSKPPLTKTQIDLISMWILQGAKDN